MTPMTFKRSQPFKRSQLWHLGLLASLLLPVTPGCGGDPMITPEPSESPTALPDSPTPPGITTPTTAPGTPTPSSPTEIPTDTSPPDVTDTPTPTEIPNSPTPPDVTDTPSPTEIPNSPTPPDVTDTPTPTHSPITPTPVRDVDGDGFPLSTDCNDNDATINPDATEQCNEVDDDCDDLTDEGVKNTYYADVDGDGFGLASATTLACEPPHGYASQAGDCDDTVNTINPGATEVCKNEVDDDCDDSTDEGCAEDRDEDGHTPEDGDCDDNDATVYPGATELCNGKDDDCDGVLDDGLSQVRFFRDTDGDEYGDTNNSLKACAAPIDHVPLQGDCDDSNANINPGATEICDGLDNDCDTQVDEGTLLTVYKDADRDGFGNPEQFQLVCSVPSGWVLNPSDCNDAAALIHPNAVEQCNGLDDNCNTQTDEGVSTTWYQDADQDGHGNPSVTTTACSQPDGFVASPADDCNDADPAIHPGMAEVCDQLDNNCNGTKDEGVTTTYYRDADGDGFGSSSATTQACKQPQGYADNDLDCNDADASIHPDAIEVCDDKDQDCNDQIDEGLPLSTYYKDEDGDGYGTSTQPLQACKVPDGYVSMSGDCNDTNKAIHPNATETCNNIDDNCDGAKDEGLPTQTWYKDGDYDGYGSITQSQVSCTQPTGFILQSGDCNDSDKYTLPGAAEKESDTLCMTDADTDGYGARSPLSGITPGTDCLDSDTTINPGRPETCNGKDDDCDGLVDAADLGECPKDICEVDDNSVCTLGVTCFNTLQKAINSTAPACTTIYVNDGTYVGFTVQKPGPYKILSKNGAATTIINAANGSVVFANTSAGAVTNDTVLDGFTLQNGKGVAVSMDGTTRTVGGGMYLAAGAAPTLKNLVFRSNSANYGGGLFISGACSTCTQSPVLDNLTIGSVGAGNSAQFTGGGIDIRDIPSTRPLKIQGDYFVLESNALTDFDAGTGNIARDSGAGMQLISSTVQVTTAVMSFLNNNARAKTNNDGFGGGAHLWSSTLNLQDVELLVKGNQASRQGAGIYVGGSSTLKQDATSTARFENNQVPNWNGMGWDGGALLVYQSSVVTLTAPAFLSNYAPNYGGAIQVDNSGTLSLTGATFTGNYTSYYNGGAINSNGSVVLTDSTFTSNTAGSGAEGGAVAVGGNVTATGCTFQSNTAGGGGGAIYAGGSVTLTNSLFSGNKANSQVGGAIWVRSGATLKGSTFTSNYAASNGGAIEVEGALALEDTQFSNNTAAVHGGAINAGGAVTLSCKNYSSLTFSSNKATGGSAGGINTAGPLTSTCTLVLRDNVAGKGEGGAINVYTGALTASELIVTGNKATAANTTSVACAALRAVGGGSIQKALIYGNTSSGGLGGIVCMDGSSGLIQEVLFSGNQVSANSQAGAIRLTGQNHKVRYVTTAYTQNSANSATGGDLYNESTNLTVEKSIFQANLNPVDLQLAYGVNSTTPLKAISENVLYSYGISGCSYSAGGCGREDLSPLFLNSTDDNNLCDEDYHLSSSNDPSILDYGMYGLDEIWDEDLWPLTGCE